MTAPKTANLRLRVTSEMMNSIKSAASRIGESESFVVREAIRKYLAHHEETEDRGNDIGVVLEERSRERRK